MVIKFLKISLSFLKLFSLTHVAYILTYYVLKRERSPTQVFSFYTRFSFLCHALLMTRVQGRNQLPCGPGSSVGIATELRPGRSGNESRWGRDFPPFQTGPGAHPSSGKMGTGSFPGINCGRGVLLTTHPLLVPLSWKSIAIPLSTLWATLGL